MTEPASANLRRIVVRGVKIAALGYFLGQGLNLVAYLAIARLISPEQFGIYAAGSLVTGVGMQLSGSGIQAALIQRRDRLEETASTAFVSSLVAGVLLATVALATAPLVSLFFRNSQAGAIAAALAGWAVLRCASIVPDTLMQRRFSFMRRVVVDPVGIGIFGLVSIVAVSNGMGAWGLVAGTYASATARLILSWALAHWRPDIRLASFEIWVELARFSRHVFASESVRRLTSELPTIVIGRVFGADALGQLRYGLLLGMQPRAAVTNVASYVTLPAFARIADDAERFRRAFLSTLRWVIVFAFPAGMILLPLGEPLALVLLGKQWEDAGSVMMGLCAVTGAGSLISVSSEAFKAAGRPDVLPRVHGLSALATAISIFALIPLGLPGVAVALSLSSIVVAWYAVRAACRIIDVPGQRVLAEVRPVALASLVMAAAVGALDLVLDAASRPTAAALAVLAIEGVAGVAIYGLALRLLAPATGRELWRAVAASRLRVGRHR